MNEKTPEELQKIVDKWKHVLEGPSTPLSACKVMLIEPFTTWNQEYCCNSVNGGEK